MLRGVMLHIRVVTPSDLRVALLAALDRSPAVHNVVTLLDVARRPDGDLVQFDVAREAANEVIQSLRDLDLHRRGSIAIERVDASLSDVAAYAEARAPGDPSEAVVWEEVEARVRGESSLSWSYLVTMSVAVMIGAVAVLTDSPVLIVGAMVVGPDYGPVAGLTLNVHRRRLDRTRSALLALGVGYVVAILWALLLTLGVRLIGNLPVAYESGIRPLTSFVAQPDGWSVIVAILAGVAGTIALTQAKAGAIVGVLISVTTIPAASNVAVAIGTGRWNEAQGAAAQLLLNLVLMVVVGVGVLRIEQRLSRVSVRRTPS